MKLSASVYAGDRSVWTARANKTVHKLSTLPINKTKSVSLASVFLHILFPNTEVCISLVLSLSLSLPFGDLFAACLEAMARKVYCGAELKSELNYVLLVRTDYQKRTEQQKKKSPQPLMELWDICDFPLSDERSWKFWPSRAPRRSKHHPPSDKPVRHPFPVSTFSTVFVCELFVLEGLMYYTTQERQDLRAATCLSSPPPPPQLRFMGVTGSGGSETGTLHPKKIVFECY